MLIYIIGKNKITDFSPLKLALHTRQIALRNFTMSGTGSGKSRRKEAILAAARMCKSMWQEENRIAAISPSSLEVVAAIINDIEPFILSSIDVNNADPPIILDAGCGDARWLVEISRHFNKKSRKCVVNCVGIDINIDSALKHLDGLKTNQLSEELSYAPDNGWLDSIELVKCDMFKNFSFRAQYVITPVLPNYHSVEGKLPASVLVESPQPRPSSLSVMFLHDGDFGGVGNEPHFELTAPTVLICYLSREGNLLLQNKLILECKISQEGLGSIGQLVLISVGFKMPEWKCAKVFCFNGLYAYKYLLHYHDR